MSRNYCGTHEASELLIGKVSVRHSAFLVAVHDIAQHLGIQLCSIATAPACRQRAATSDTTRSDTADKNRSAKELQSSKAAQKRMSLVLLQCEAPDVEGCVTMGTRQAPSPFLDWSWLWRGGVDS